MKTKRTPLSALEITGLHARIERDLTDPENFAQSDRALGRHHGVAHTTITKYKKRLAEKVFDDTNPLNLSPNRIADLKAVISDKSSLVIRKDGTRYPYPRRRTAIGVIGAIGVGVNGVGSTVSVNQPAEPTAVRPAEPADKKPPIGVNGVGAIGVNGVANGVEKSMSVKEVITEAAHGIRDLYFTPDATGARPIERNDMPEGFLSDNADRIREIIDTICVRERVDFKTITEGAKAEFIKTPFPIDYFNLDYTADRHVDIVENAVDDYLFMPGDHIDGAAAWDNEHGVKAAEKLAQRMRFKEKERGAVLAVFRTMFIDMVDKKGDAW